MTLAKLHDRMDRLQIPIGMLMIVGVLYVAKAVIVPLVVAVLLTFVLTPIVAGLQRCGIKRAYGVAITVLLALALFGAAGYIVGAQLHSLASELPHHRKEIEAKIATLRDGGGLFDEVFQMFREISRDAFNPKTGDIEVQQKDVIITRPEEPSSAEKIFQALVPVLEPLVHAGFVMILVIFMLFHREDLRNRFLGLLGNGRLTGTTRVIVDSAQRLSDYLLALSVINFCFGALFAVGLYFMNVRYAILWGFLTAMMRFIPYIGTWIAVVLPLTLSFATSPTWMQPVALLVYFGILEVVTANVIEPLLLGSRTGVSPIALLVAAAFWTWLWGPIGLMLSTPLTACLVVIGQHVPRFQFFAILLGDQPPLDPRVRYYQRLLARDEDEAREVAVEYVKAEGLDRVYDNVLLPALVMARQDRQDAGVAAEDERFILAATHEILSGIDADLATTDGAGSGASARTQEGVPASGASAVAPESLSPDAHPVLILGCPAHQQAEELALQMLAKLLKPAGCDVDLVSTRMLPTEIEARIEHDMPALVFIAVLPPGGLVQARYLCRRLRRRFPSLSIVVGYWGVVNDFDRLFRQVRSAGGNYVATSLLQARSQIGALMQPARSVEPQPEAAVLEHAGN